MQDDAVDLVSLIAQLKVDIKESNFDSSLKVSRQIEKKLKEVNFLELNKESLSSYNEIYAFYSDYIKILINQKVKLQSEFSETVAARKAIKVYKSL
jgi:hypothetical protein